MTKKRKIRMDYSMLRGRIYERFGTISNFAKEYGITAQGMSYKLRNRNDFTQADIFKISELLEIMPDQVGEYFFTPLTRKCE